MKFKTSILLILLAMATLLFCACDDQAPVDTTTPDESLKDYEYIDPTENCANIYDVSATIQEQMRSDYDKYVDKDNNKWESNWKSSSLAPTAQVKIGVSNDATGNYTDNLNGMPALGVDTLNTTVPLMVILELLDDSIISDNNCKLNLESKRTYKGIESGAIGSGMLIIEKSYDNFDWSRIDSSEYQNGLFTTNYRTHYGNNPVLIYTPSGADLNHGVYVRITYIYEAEHTYTGKNLFGFDKQKTDSKIFREQSTFYLCNENLDAVKFHNKTVSDDMFSKAAKDDSGCVSEEYRFAETLTNGAMTVSGFQIDNSMQNVTVSVSKDGFNIQIPENGEFTETGKYDITLTQSIGQRIKHIVLYIDKRPFDEINSYYFGEGFVDGKRIYWEGEYPLFEGGYTKYNILPTTDAYPALYGTITNTSTGKSIKINTNISGATGELLEAGEYIATFYNNPTFETDYPSGDVRIITFRFSLIAKGTAPGPQVNKESLQNYASSNVSDYYPLYYGVTYPSAGPGNITLIFSNYQDAFEFAYNYEKGCVEKQSDGTFRYSGTLSIGVKEKYNSVWDLTDATNFFAEQAVQKLYFDPTDEFTYLTLEESIIENCENLRTLELSKSVFIFFSEEHRNAAVAKNKLPVIAYKKYQYLTPGLNGTVSIGSHDFQFVKDENGYDSAKVVIIDSAGKTINIEYNKDVYQQLKDAECVTGIITIKEETVYGDSVEYQAIYFAEGINTTTAKISFKSKGQNNIIFVSQMSQIDKLEVNSFSFDSITDELDPNAIIKVTKDGEEKIYTFDEALCEVWTSQGEYTVEFINRLGYSYQIEFSIKSSIYINISFIGVGTENLGSITVTKDQTRVVLPLITRYGYNLIGYEDKNGNVYTSFIEPQALEENMILSPIWEAKYFTLTIVNNYGTVIQIIPVQFGNNYTLPSLALNPGETFVGWLLDDEPFEDDTITISQENDIVLVANIYSHKTEENASTTDQEYQTSTDSTRSGCGSVILPSGTVFMIIVSLVAAVFCLKRKED